MGNLSQTSAIMSLITFLQNIGSAIDFDKFPVTAKIKKWAGALKNLITLIATAVLSFFAVVFLIPGLLGLCEWSRRLRLKLKSILKKLTFTVFALFLDIFYVPILTYFLQIIYSTSVQCPEGYYWGAYRGEDALLKTKGHCIPCGPILKYKYPGIQNFINDQVSPNTSASVFRKFTKFMSNNPGILEETFNALNASLDPYSEITKTCPYLCSGNPVRVVKSEPSIYFDYQILPTYTLFLYWAIAFVMIGCPVLYFFLINRARKQFKTMAAYGDSKEYRWHCLMIRVETVGAKFCKDLTYFNPYWAIVKILCFTCYYIGKLCTQKHHWLSSSFTHSDVYIDISSPTIFCISQQHY
ncbi:hypothetical protein TVAG_216100 [Trichomonas vaginalis G3]|uniref:Uncharacterized protein n=1 Tax=Trichomonas vaginalis (strain ATCC PRA-98 / G3) TaxID=412133 RepID=A2ENU4_TRIV3|nr:hypothetical protein TVAGG3_0249210 [Trichomonas vaginalis G3]EAY05634.1 hypothetical protein TVAG_216100 [Trichomonas vaginalis G3]KAI5553874.1 hypothetical protein TVAGG3_0249210 [Trichomonas vaginalis G3]|eukprot:XP_001317857.1 hypothetical protein [Trichomonas vaginalis G3]